MRTRAWAYRASACADEHTPAMKRHNKGKLGKKGMMSSLFFKFLLPNYNPRYKIPVVELLDSQIIIKTKKSLCFYFF